MERKGIDILEVGPLLLLGEGPPLYNVGALPAAVVVTSFVAVLAIFVFVTVVVVRICRGATCWARAMLPVNNSPSPSNLLRIPIFVFAVRA